MLNFLFRGLRRQPAIDRAILDSAPRTAVALGLLSGLAIAVILLALALAVATIAGFEAGTPSGNFTAVLKFTWPAFVILIAAGGAAGISRRYVLELHPGWGRIGAGVAVFAVFLLLAVPWAFRQRLIQGDALTRRTVYEVPGGLYRATESDGILLLLFGLAALVGAILFSVIAGGILDSLVRRALPIVETGPEEPTHPPSDFQSEQTGLSRLKLEIIELRRRNGRRRPIDPVISATNVIDRETGRAVPPWMEPIADLNFRLGKGLLIAFIISALVWFTAVASKAPEEWLVWRNAIFVTPRTGTFIIPVDIVANVSAIRLHAVTGEGDVIGALARRGAPDTIPGRVVRVRGFPEPLQSDPPPQHHHLRRPRSRSLRPASQLVQRLRFDRHDRRAHLQPLDPPPGRRSRRQRGRHACRRRRARAAYGRQSPGLFRSLIPPPAIPRSLLHLHRILNCRFRRTPGPKAPVPTPLFDIMSPAQSNLWRYFTA